MQRFLPPPRRGCDLAFTPHALCSNNFLQLPREPNAVRMQRLRQRYDAEHPWPRIAWSDAEALVLGCWARLDGSERRDTHPDPAPVPA
ncbi:hypothetical protein A6R73_03750 [Xanthomonas translucens pv. poae]|uniref:Uncharacterized protein n=2 Tax=Xanthomonas translucens group TaxID=3390202 RepID=A0A199NZI8_9XANT|nr:hypothetical protein A6R73_03750 [Xanthomonas translucens pv. poae]